MNYLSLAFRNLRRNSKRTLLTMLSTAMSMFIFSTLAILIALGIVASVFTAIVGGLILAVSAVTANVAEQLREGLPESQRFRKVSTLEESLRILSEKWRL